MMYLSLTNHIQGVDALSVNAGGWRDLLRYYHGTQITVCITTPSKPCSLEDDGPYFSKDSIARYFRHFEMKKYVDVFEEREEDVSLQWLIKQWNERSEGRDVESEIHSNLHTLRRND